MVMCRSRVVVRPTGMVVVEMAATKHAISEHDVVVLRSPVDAVG